MRRSSAAALLVPAAVATVLVACGGRNDVPVAHDETDAAGDVAEALPPGVAYVIGAYTCCEEDLGDTCCAPGEACGAYMACSPVGGWASARLACSRCCAGLKQIPRATVVDSGCVVSTTPDDSFCAACGDGACRADEGESSCNCPEDCR